MTYVPQGPFADDEVAVSAEVAAAWDAALVADDAAISKLVQQVGALQAPAPAAQVFTAGVWLDSFAGATDDAKLTAAMTAAAAQSPVPPILLQARQHVFTQPRTLYDGFALLGSPGMSNAELGSKGTAKTVVSTPVGSVWLTAAGGVRSSSQVWDVTIQDIAFTGSSSTQWMGGSSVLWCMNLRDCSWSGYRSVLGSQATKLLLDLCLLDGWLSFNDSYTGAIHVGGSDNNLFMGTTNIDSATAYLAPGGSTGQFHVWLDSMEKTVIGPAYVTCEGGWGGLRVTGPAYNTGGSNLGGPIWATGVRVEGRNAGAPCDGANVRVDGGSLILRDSWIGYGMASPATMGHTPPDAGVVHQSAGQVTLSGCTYDHATAVAEAVPMLFQSGGVATLKDTLVGSKGGVWSGLPRYKGAHIRTDDSVQTA